MPVPRGRAGRTAIVPDSPKPRTPEPPEHSSRPTPLAPVPVVPDVADGTPSDNASLDKAPLNAVVHEARCSAASGGLDVVAMPGRTMTPLTRTSSDVERGERETTPTLSFFVVRENNPFRLMWNTVMVLLLLYTATLLPFRLAYLDFKMIGSRVDATQIDWTHVDLVVNVLFWIDLVASFFFSYRDEEDREVLSWPKVVLHYVTGLFLVDLVACIPADLVEEVLGNVGPQFVRLLRLVRLSRLVKLVSFMATSPYWRYLQSLKGVRLINFGLGFFGIVHLMACGWYLVAALHTNQKETWIGRRMVYSEVGDLPDKPLLDVGPVEQWLHSMYFVLVVFTTVGFGDISATTIGEIVWVCCMMVVGGVVHSILVSRMIHVITSADQESSKLQARKELVGRFAEHVELDGEYQKELVRSVTRSHNDFEGFDPAQIQKLVAGGLPEATMQKLQKLMFRGLLARNDFIRVCGGKSRRVPVRFPVLVAAMGRPVVPMPEETIYQWRDHAWNVHLVLSGTYSFVARPHANGGISEVFVEEQSSCDSKHGRAQEVFPYMLFGIGTYFGEFELLVSKPRFSTARCERAGQLLTVAKSDFRRLVEDFPDFGIIWRDSALRKEGHRKAALKKLKHGRNYLDFAAHTIQTHLVRNKLSPRKSTWGSSETFGNFFEELPRSSCSTSGRLSQESPAAGARVSGAGRATEAAAPAEDTLIEELKSMVQRLQEEVESMRRDQQAVHTALMIRLDLALPVAAAASSSVQRLHSSQA